MYNVFLKKICLVSLLFIAGTGSFAQTLTPAQHDKKIATLSDQQKVDYVIDNNYTLYSANFDHALTLTEQARTVSRKNGWKDKEGYCQMLLGVIYYLKGDYDKALPKYLGAYTIFDSLKNYNGLARLCNEMAVFYRKQSDAKTAYDYLDKAEAFALKINDTANLGTSYGHRAVLLEREEKFEEAKILYEKVYAIRVAANDSVGIGYALLDLSSIALRAGDVQKALKFIEQSTAIRKKLGDEQGVAVNLVNTGETYYSLKDFRKSIDYFEQCLKLAVKIGYTDLVQYAYEQLAAANVQLHDYKQAFVFQQKGNAFKDSLFSVEKTKVIAELETKYETARKEQQITLQQAQLAEQKAEIRQTYIAIGALILTLLLITVIFFLARARHKKQQQLLVKEKEMAVREAYMLASIQSQENERKRFAQDLHDGMGQLISALRLSLLTVNRNSTLEERVAVVLKAEGLLNEMHREIRSIAFNLMPQTLVQHGLIPALKEMGDRINSSGMITVRVSSFDLPPRLSEVQEISLYRVIQEWVNNVVKYAEASFIEIQLVGYDQEITATIEDNGRGFNIEVLEASSGNGWKNIKSRVNLLKGNVEADSRQGRGGTTLILRIPIIVHRPLRETAEATRV